MNTVSISEIITTTKIFNISVITTAAATAESVFNIISKYLRQLPAQCDNYVRWYLRVCVRAGLYIKRLPTLYFHIYLYSYLLYNMSSLIYTSCHRSPPH